MHPAFNHSEVIVLTNKLPVKTSTSLRCAMPVGKYMENLMNEENEWDHEVSSSVEDGPADC